MINKNILIKNNINLKEKNIINKKISKNFNKIFLKLKEDIDKKKTISVLDKDYSFNFQLSKLNKFKKFKTITIIGMGGSILGVEAIHGFLKKKIKKKVYFFNNLDENKILDFKKKENINKTLFIIISKSGNTIETLTNTFLLNIIKKNAKNIIIISENKNNFLLEVSKKFNIFYIQHKKYIGGRYSVLSEVGVVPAYLMGLDLYKLRSKLKNLFKGGSKTLLKDSSVKLSNILNSRKYKNLIFLNYAPELEKFLFWCQQLIAESLGKKNKGFLPVISNAPKDHHSLLQLYLDGPKDKIFYIFSSDNFSKIKINLSKNLTKNFFLNKKYLNEIKNAQKDSLIKVLQKKVIPFREFRIKKTDEEVIGLLFSYFIMETILIGKLTKINPFDQPAVEEVKKLTKKLLN